MIEKKICKGINKARDFEGCGKLVDTNSRKSGLCKSCYYEFSTTIIKDSKENLRQYTCFWCKGKYNSTPLERSKFGRKSSCDKIECKSSLGLHIVEKQRKSNAKKEKKAWEERKEKYREDIGITSRSKTKSHECPLQKVVNKIVRILDKDKRCFVYENLMVQQAGHIFSVSTHSNLRYCFLNIHGESIHSNTNQNINDKFKLLMMQERYNDTHRNSLEWIDRNNQIVQITKEDKKMLAAKLSVLIPEVEKGLWTRRKLDEYLGIYKLPSEELYYI